MMKNFKGGLQKKLLRTIHKKNENKKWTNLDIR